MAWVPALLKLVALKPSVRANLKEAVGRGQRSVAEPQCPTGPESRGRPAGVGILLLRVEVVVALAGTRSSDL